MKKLRSFLRAGALAALSSALLAALPAAAQNAPQSAADKIPVAGQDAETVKRGIEFTRSLIETSSSAQQIDKTKVPESLAKRDEARALLKKAEEAQAKGATAEAAQLANDAKRVMFMAVRLASPEQVRGEKQARDYENRLASVKILRDALARLGGTKNAAAIKEADGMLAEAGKHAAQKNFELALATVDKAYGVIKSMNIEQRDHTEQVASKTFASKADEYKYEVARNDDYLQLSAAVLSNMAENLAGMYRPVREKAGELRKGAEARAGSGDYDGAVTAMETSTAEYKKIIRAGGIPVP